MGTLYLVRHSQASFGADNYDVLSSMGHRQSVRLGEYFKSKGLTFDAALTGTLNRQIQTFAGICEGMGMEPDALRQTGLNEYDAEAVIAAIHPAKLEKPTSPEMVRSHFRLLKDGLAQWMAGVVSPRGMPSYTDFVADIAGVLDHVKTSYTGNVLLVSSGGPIATAVGHVLGTSPEATIDLNLRIRNCSVTEFAFTPKRHMLVTYNTLPHLDAPEHADWITYS
ncbi:histidine phosphatase family protein [Polaromonas sp. YR568]|uniref:histidine phosphatase family protein n=1 Tax=Polaromonas sp. YR568 TaxID=1855301 RepID=UPI00313839AA